MDGNTAHFVAGAAGGTAGAVLTCPLEVLKTRLQSSKKSLLTDHRLPIHEVPQHFEYHKSFHAPLRPSLLSRVRMYEILGRIFITSGGPANALVSERADYTTAPMRPRLGILACFRNIIINEGPGALFKGLIPNLVGVAPSRAIYFAAYAHGKVQLNQSNLFNPDTPVIHICAAAFAGFSSATCTNPIWVMKTRMQLNPNSVSTFQCARNIYAEGGLKAFYKGVTASYYGLTETIIHLVIYEEIKRFLNSSRSSNPDLNSINEVNSTESLKEDLKSEVKSVAFVRSFFEYMGAGAISKTIATIIAYPHEVARTRLREENSKHNKFWQTLACVHKDEGFKGVYRGLGVQLIRQIPNTAVVMATYEAVVYLLSGGPLLPEISKHEYD